MRDLQYLQLLAEQYPSEDIAAAALVEQTAALALPKGTEFFFSDLHGEHEAFIHLLRSASGVIRDKIEMLFQQSVPETERASLAALIYYPDRQLYDKSGIIEHDDEWFQITLNRLILVAREVVAKYPRKKVRATMTGAYSTILDELLYLNGEDKQVYFRRILETTIRSGAGVPMIEALCQLIRQISVDQLHIIGDIFDRGPRADRIIEELMLHRNVDIQWGNHDLAWMGAMSGNLVCVANVIRISIRYNGFDVLEDGYGINLRALSMFASEIYGDDPCERFMPEMLDKNKYDPVDPALAAKMHKAISIIQFKLEGQLIARHPHYEMEDRMLLDKIDYEKGAITIGGTTYPLLDKNFPTVDPKDPWTLTEEEEQLIHQLASSFRHGSVLKKHIDYLYSHGALYKIVNGNLLYHGCIPMREDGSFDSWQDERGREYKGKALFDYIDRCVRRAYFEQNPKCVDLMWYLWCGAKSPLYGKDRMTTFERYFIAEKELYKERMSAYYTYCEQSTVCEKILEAFGLHPESAHIVNGHVPVRRGENPVKAGGRLYVIDGGISKAYQSKTGIAGYTLIYNSHNIALAEHQAFQSARGERVPDENHAKIQIVEMMRTRKTVADTNEGQKLEEKIKDLEALIRHYRSGVLDGALIEQR